MDITPVLAKEIISRLCKYTDGAAATGVTTELAAFVVRLSLFNSSDCDERGNVAKTPEAIEAMAESISKYLAGCSPHMMATLSLQFQTNDLRRSFATKRRNERVKEEAVTMRLVGSLCENVSRLPEEMLSEIVFFILHRYRQLGSGEGNIAVRRETASVLSSVLPPSQVLAFASQSEAEKKRQLEELRRIVWGIRLYNVAEERSAGAGLVALKPKAESLVTSLGQRIAQELEIAAAACTNYTTFMRSPSAVISKDERQKIQEEYHLELQMMLNLRTARQRLEDLSARIFGELIPAYDAALEELKKVLDETSMRADGLTLRSNIPKRVVYPKFIALADAYEDAEQVFDSFEEIQALLDLSLSLGAVATPSLPSPLLREAFMAAKDDAPADRAAIMEHIASLGTTPSMLYATNPTELRQHLTLRALNGMCPVTLMEDGVCVEGRMSEDDPAFPGFVVRAASDDGRGKWYAFRNESALRQFAASPLLFIDNAVQVVQQNMVFAGLLDMLDSLPHELYIVGTRKYEKPEKLVVGEGRRDGATQTGQIDPYMDHNYCWNEWDLRRQALKLVNLLDMRTHSVQTIASHFRRDNSTQARPPRDDSTQTTQDAAVQPPQTVQYLKGLRGTRTSAIETVQRTFLY